MAALGIRNRADRAIVQRQQWERKHDIAVGMNVDQFKTESKAHWENKSEEVIRANRVRAKANSIHAAQQTSLQDRRQKLAAMLAEEQSTYEREMVEMEESPQQRMDKMAVRAYKLKKKREDERKAVVQEKLYQQWRDGIDELRTMDSKIVQLKTISDRDHQLAEKQELGFMDKEQDQVFDQLWHEGYLAKIEREERERALKKERDAEQTRILGLQLDMKARRIEADRAEEGQDQAVLKKLWAAQEVEEKQSLVKEKVIAKAERKKADEFMHIQQAHRSEQIFMEKQQDRDFVDAVLTRERKLTEHEEMEKEKAKKKAREFTEALKIEMARKAQSEEELIRLQQEESDRQYQKQYNKWEKEELARRQLMEEVYNDRAEQVVLKQDIRERMKNGVHDERDRIDREVSRLEAIEQEREEAEKMVHGRHQEELFRQMDFHQVQRHRQLQQQAIEQRQAGIAEEKIRRAVKVETDKATSIMKEVVQGRNRVKASSVVAPWDR